MTTQLYDTPLVSTTVLVPKEILDEIRAEAKARHVKVAVIVRERLMARRPEDPARGWGLGGVQGGVAEAP